MLLNHSSESQSLTTETSLRAQSDALEVYGRVLASPVALCKGQGHLWISRDDQMHDLHRVGKDNLVIGKDIQELTFCR